MELQGKKVLVFGSGKSGIGASDLLAKVGAFPVIYDGNAETDKNSLQVEDLSALRGLKLPDQDCPVLLSEVLLHIQ